jgi:hypothetical protein
VRRSRAILIGLVVLAVGCVSRSATNASPTILGERTATPTQSASSAPVLDDRFGFINADSSAGPRPVVRRESDPQPIFTLGEFGLLAVAPSGRQVAYWIDNKLQILEVVPNAQPRIVFDLSAEAAHEEYVGLAWSSDSTGLVVATNAPSPIMAADAPPEYGALRVVEVAGGPPREIIKVPGRQLNPLLWDRRSRLVAAYSAYSSGIGTYYVIEESGNAQVSNVAPGLITMDASPDAQQILATGFTPDFVSVWPVIAPARATELRSSASERILAARWRPGTTELAVVFSDRLELWQASGGRRVVPLPPLPQTSNVNRTLAFRVDGSAAIVGVPIDGRPEIYTVAVDLANGRSAVLTTGGTASLTPVRLIP